MIVVLVCAQMLGQGIDAVGEQCDLHVGRASVASVEPVLLNDSGSVGLSQGHTCIYLSLLISVTLGSIALAVGSPASKPER